MSKDLLSTEEAPRMAPETLTVINNYLETSDVSKTSNMLGIPREKVISILNKKEAKRYVDAVFMEQGYLNRSKIADAMSTIIDRKLEELEEAELGSNKDIADLLMMMSKIRTDEMKLIQADEKSGTVLNQTNNTQNINTQFGENYGSLLDKLSG